MARFLFLHPNLPGQYKHLAPALAADQAHEVVFLTEQAVTRSLENVRKLTYAPASLNQSTAHPYAQSFDAGVATSLAVAKVCLDLRQEGFRPDAVIGHLGWGQGLYIKDVWPETRILNFFEYFYTAEGSSSAFFPNEGLDVGGRAKLRSRNATLLMSMTDSDWAITPTIFQFRQHPPAFWQKMSLLHDGVDTDAARPGPRRPLTLPDGGPTLTPDDEVVTYIARNFEPYRGFPTFMRAAARLQKERPKAHVIFVGQEGVSYGKRPPDGLTYRQIMEAEVSLDPARTHWLGYLPHHEMIRVMQLSRAHVYLTVPFVLSWSLLEAMATGCAVIGSDTPPVREVIEDGRNGLLCDFFSPEDVVDKIIRVLDAKDDMAAMRREARRTIVQRYALDLVLPFHVALAEDIAEGRIPPPTAERIRQFNRLFDHDPEHPPAGMMDWPAPPNDKADYVDLDLVRRLKAEHDARTGAPAP